MGMNWNADEERANAPQLPPGRYVVEVESCDLRYSKKDQSAYLNPRLVLIDRGRPHVCYDTIMLEGRGESIGVAKLKALGLGPADEVDGTIPPEKLVGRRAIVHVVRGSFGEQERLEVDIKAKGTKCGYEPMPQPGASTGAHLPVASTPVAPTPAGSSDESPSNEPTTDDDVPF